MNNYLKEIREIHDILWNQNYDSYQKINLMRQVINEWEESLSDKKQESNK